MSEYYYNVYRRRLNRYGLDYQSRIQNQRERDFESYLYKSIYRVDFKYDGVLHPGSLERYKQDYTETQGYLLTRRELQIPNGTILNIESQDGSESVWMVWWLERIETSGYNRYIILKMTHYLTWKNGEKETSQWAYFSGPGNKAITDAIQTSGATAIYRENNNLHMFITPTNESLIRESYFEVKQSNIVQGYKIQEFDINSTPGVAYVTVDPVPLRGSDEKPKIDENDNNEDIFWLTGGAK